MLTWEDDVAVHALRNVVGRSPMDRHTGRDRNPCRRQPQHHNLNHRNLPVAHWAK